jgi:FAD/FMN-containing dehydrogenase
MSSEQWRRGTTLRRRGCGLQIDRSEQALATVTEGFGHVVRGKPLGIIRPTSARDVTEAVREASPSGWTLTIRGTGHSAGGPRQVRTLDSP